MQQNTYYCDRFLNFIRGLIIVVLAVMMLSSIAFPAELPKDLGSFRDQLVVEVTPGGKLLPAKKVIITDVDVLVDPKYPSPDYYIYDFASYKHIRVFDVDKNGKVIEIKIRDDGRIEFADESFIIPKTFEK